MTKQLGLALWLEGAYSIRTIDLVGYMPLYLTDRLKWNRWEWVPLGVLVWSLSYGFDLYEEAMKSVRRTYGVLRDWDDGVPP